MPSALRLSPHWAGNPDEVGDGSLVGSQANYRLVLSTLLKDQPDIAEDGPYNLHLALAAFQVVAENQRNLCSLSDERPKLQQKFSHASEAILFD
jgi:hypothetical protein